MSSENPRLRYLEAFPHTHEGRPMVVLRDPLRVSEEILLVTPECYSLLTLLDGSHSVREIQAALSKRAGQLVFSDPINALVARLDEVGFLDNENFRRRYVRLLEEFRAAPLRRAVHAGASYPDQPAQLLETIGSFYTGPGGAGLPGSRSEKLLKGLAAPHIDLRLGGPTYTHAYRALAESRPPETFVILGTGHVGLPQLFSVCRKDFESPLGEAVVDRELLRCLDEALEPGLFDEDLTHRNEHSIEFQIPFLQHLLPRGSFQILPVLCSFGYEEIRGQGTIDADRLFDRFVSALRQAVERSGRRVCYLASVDLAHVGPRYGDPGRPGPEDIRRVLRLDREMLEPALKGNPDGFFDFVAKEEDRRKICGFAPLYTLLHLLADEKGRLLAHDQSQMDPTGSFVSYASLAWG